MPKHSLSTWARLVAILALTILVVPSNSAAAEPAPQAPLEAPIEPAVTRQLAAQGKASYWIVLRPQANLDRAPRIADWNARGQYVYERLTSLANSTQSGLAALLKKSGASYTRYWIVNAIYATSDTAVLNAVRRQPEVMEIRAPEVFTIPEPIPAPAVNQTQAVEWNVERIRAPQVWSTYGDTGQGIVVANIDTGVQFDHPALVAKYRGNLGGGAFDHNYNWYDPSHICGNPSTVPCDNSGHGTHTMGTMVGDDGAGNRIGVAPGARFIIAKGCESSSCSQAALLSAGQWILAPTDLSGQNPRTDLRPHVVNNSWGGGPGSFWYQGMVRSWVAAGIFPAFSAGNSGPSCRTASSPGDYPESYASGAFDINNAIAGFSARGAAGYSDIIGKPNIAAPGVNVRSSIPGSGFAGYSGTSMASPHTAATVALMWSAAPSLVGDIARTRAILDQTAVDTDDQTCGGTATNNNVWGEGKLDAFMAVTQSPRGPLGALQGTVRDAGTNAALAGAEVEVVSGPFVRDATTDANGSYSFPVLTAGAYQVTAWKFGYLSGSATVSVLEGNTAQQDFVLATAPAHALSGYVRNHAGQPVAMSTVTIVGTPLAPGTTDANGYYAFASVPAGAYDVTASVGGCNGPQTQPLDLAGDLTNFDFTLPQRTDAFGYSCQVQAPAYVEAGTVLALTGDQGYVQVSLPFGFPLYGYSYNSAYVATDGYLTFEEANNLFLNGGLPSLLQPNAALYPFWDDLIVDSLSSVRTESLASPKRFVIEWRNVHPYDSATQLIDFEVVLYETGEILTQYRNIADDGRERGNSATLGIENQTGTVALQYSLNEAAINTPEFAILYSTFAPPPPLITIDDVSVIEGDVQTVDATFTVSLSQPATGGESFTWATAPGSAMPGSDYTEAGGTLSFTANQTAQTVTVRVIGDPVVESDETFYVNLSNPAGVILADRQAMGTIVNDDSALSLHVGDLDGTSTAGRKNSWTATVTIAVHDANHSPMSSATVTALWEGSAAPVSCRTGKAGTCMISSASIPAGTGSIKLRVTNIAGSGYAYKPLLNHDPDPDSNGTEIVVMKP